MQVMIAVPSHDTVSVRFAGDLAQLYALSSASLMGQVDLNLVIGTYVHDARERLAIEAIESRATHVLWIDSDMRFPRDALLRLLSHGVDVVGINYSTRVPPSRFVAAGLHASGRVITGPESRGLEEVAALGFGMVLTGTEALRRTLVSGGSPLFRYEWVPDPGIWVGEDFSFCRRAREAGVGIWVDHDLSKECAHIGAFEYRTEHALEPVEAV